jgi:hypothetical protein
MHDYIFYNTDKESAKQRINDMLKESEIPKIVNIEWINDDLSITITKAGQSKVILALREYENDIVIAEKEREIAWLHKSFISMVETIIEQKILQAGAFKRNKL